MHVSNEREKTKGHDNAGHTIISEGTTGHGIKIRKKQSFNIIIQIEWGSFIHTHRHQMANNSLQELKMTMATKTMMMA